MIVIAELLGCAIGATVFSIGYVYLTYQEGFASFWQTVLLNSVVSTIFAIILLYGFKLIVWILSLVLYRSK
mgnify:CR=1 FL=1